METRKIISYLKENLSDYRFKHTIGVAETAKKLAAKYGENEEDAFTAGLLHDIAKELSLKEMLDLAKKYQAEIDPVSRKSTALMHGIVGAYLAQDLFGISSKIFGGIRFHTTGKANMSLFEKIIYIADYIEPNRNFDGVEKARETAFEDIDKAILDSCNKIVIHTVNKGGIIHPDTIDARNYLLENNRSVAENEEEVI